MPNYSAYACTISMARPVLRDRISLMTHSQILAVIETYDGMIVLAWARGERALDLLALRGEWVARLAGVA